MFPGAVSSFHPDMLRIIFIHVMRRVRIIISQEKELWRIRRGGKSTNIIFRGNINGSWNQIWGISGYFMRAGSIINDNGRDIQS